MDVRKVDWALFTQLVEEHKFDATSLRWGNSDVVQDPYEIWHSSQTQDGSNYVFFRNPEVDRLIETARATLDDARRNELYRSMGRLLYDQAPYVFLYSRPSLDAGRADVRGLRPSIACSHLQDGWLQGRCSARSGTACCVRCPWCWESPSSPSPWCAQRRAL